MKITWADIEAKLPNHVHLCELDTRDVNYRHDADSIQNCIHKNELTDIDLDWINENEWDSISQIKSELENALESDFSDDEIETAMSEYDDEIRDWCYENDKSTPLKDYYNASNASFFYDSGYEMEDGSWAWNNKRIAREVRKIMTHLGIAKKEQNQDTHLWKELWDCVQNATYGGSVEIYFTQTPWEVMELPDGPQIRFSQGTIGIINHANGSGFMGDHCKFKSVLPFKRENIFMEYAISYNWSYNICGQSIEYYKNTDFEIGQFTKKVIPEIKSDLNSHIERQNEYDRVFKSGSCSPGDMNITRHRNVYYRNTPLSCGNKCENCGTFWID